MNTNMWRHPATQANLASLAARGHAFVGPDRGELACGWVGEGRMIDPAIIGSRALEIAAGVGKAPEWRGRRVLVSAGPTREYLDPVRYLSNGSTGVMGFALAQDAARRGAEVTLVAGPVDRPTPTGVRRRNVVTAAEMLAVMEEELASGPYTLVAMTAAVADLVPARRADAKLPKGDLLPAMEGLSWNRAVDVLETLTSRHGRSVFFLGFAAETVEDDVTDVASVLTERGRDKLARKRCQALFVNRVGVEGTGFGSATNAGLLLVNTPKGLEVRSSGPPRAKEQLAAWLLNEIAPELRGGKR
jgi:phosphopantothenoylcysteine decarboxylase/phosphopantothenate--cysteine ligase